MQIVPPALGNLDIQIADIRGMVDALIFMQEESEPQRLRDASIALLYVINDKLAHADRVVASLHRALPGNAA